RVSSPSTAALSRASSNREVGCESDSSSGCVLLACVVGGCIFVLPFPRSGQKSSTLSNNDCQGRRKGSATSREATSSCFSWAWEKSGSSRMTRFVTRPGCYGDFRGRGRGVYPRGTLVAAGGSEGTGDGVGT